MSPKRKRQEEEDEDLTEPRKHDSVKTNEEEAEEEEEEEEDEEDVKDDNTLLKEEKIVEFVKRDFESMGSPSMELMKQILVNPSNSEHPNLPTLRGIDRFVNVLRFEPNSVAFWRVLKSQKPVIPIAFLKTEEDRTQNGYHIFPVHYFASRHRRARMWQVHYLDHFGRGEPAPSWPFPSTIKQAVSFSWLIGEGIIHWMQRFQNVQVPAKKRKKNDQTYAFEGPFYIKQPVFENQVPLLFSNSHLLENRTNETKTKNRNFAIFQFLPDEVFQARHIPILRTKHPIGRLKTDEEGQAPKEPSCEHPFDTQGWDYTFLPDDGLPTYLFSCQQPLCFEILQKHHETKRIQQEEEEKLMKSKLCFYSQSSATQLKHFVHHSQTIKQAVEEEFT
jgi:hypothetical protein